MPIIGNGLHEFVPHSQNATETPNNHGHPDRYWARSIFGWQVIEPATYSHKRNVPKLLRTDDRTSRTDANRIETNLQNNNS